MGLAISRFFGTFTLKRRTYKVVMLGLPECGKTSILFKLCLNQFVSMSTTIGFQTEMVRYKAINFEIMDLGGQEKIRQVWKKFYRESNAIIFVINGVDAKITTVAEQLRKVLNNKNLTKAPLLVLVNKYDLGHGILEEDIITTLGLNNIQDRPWLLQRCSAFTGEGLYEGLDFLYKVIRK